MTRGRNGGRAQRPGLLSRAYIGSSCRCGQAGGGRSPGGRCSWSASQLPVSTRYAVNGRDVRTVAKNILPSSLPTPSNTFRSPDSVMGEVWRPIILPFIIICGGNGPPDIIGRVSDSSCSSREGNAQSMSSIRNIACFGMEATAR